MKSLCVREFGAGLALLVGLLVSHPLYAETLSLDDCMREALKNNNLHRLTALDVEEHEAEQKSVRGRFLPVVKAEMSVLGWNDKHVFDTSFITDLFDVILGSLPAGLAESLAEQLAASGAQDQELVMRKDLTIDTKLTVAQPLTQLYRVWGGYEASGELAAASRMSRREARRKLELDVANVYFGLITAMKLTETARAALSQIEEYERQVTAYLEAELVEKNALLKVHVHKAEIRKNLFLAEKGAKLARAALNLYMARPLDSPLEPVEPEESGMETPGQAQARPIESALSKRPDLLALKHQRRAARAGKHAAIGSLLPDITAIFTYENAQGLDGLQPENQYFGGIVLNWNIWEWGATWYQLRKSQVRERKVSTAIQAMEEGIRLDIKRKRLELEEAEKSLGVAEAQVREAEENLRIEKIRFDAQMAATTDLLNAQTSKLKAESDAITARMNVTLARMALHVGLGDDLLEDGRGEK